MSAIGDIVFDRTSANHEEIWDDTELIRAYDRTHRQIQNRLRNNPKKKKDKSVKNVSNTKEKVVRSQSSPSVPVQLPLPIPPMMISPPKDEHDALHSMLMAWYMAGYHAGRLAALNEKTSS